MYEIASSDVRIALRNSEKILFSPTFTHHNFANRLRDKIKGRFIATEYFELARNAFWRTRWNDTQVRLTGREVTVRYSLPNTICKIIQLIDY